MTRNRPSTRPSPTDRAPDDVTPSRDPDFHVTVDVLLFSIRNDIPSLGVVQRRGTTAYLDQNRLARRRTPTTPRDVVPVPRDPRLHWALPGGHVGHRLLGDRYGTGNEPDLSLEAAALRVVERETGLRLTSADLHQVRAFGDHGRDPRSGRTITIAYLAVIGEDDELTLHPDSDVGHVSRVQFRPIIDLLARPSHLEFDHEDIVLEAIRQLRSLAVTTPIAAAFCRPEFTLGELRRVFELLFHESLDSAEAAESYVAPVRAYLQKLEKLSDPSLQRTMAMLASSMPASFESSVRPRLSSGAVFARQAELLDKLRRDSDRLRPPKPPRLIKRFDPTNFNRKLMKLDILDEVPGQMRQTFERYGKVAGTYRLRPTHSNARFLLRLDGLSKDSDSSE